jgi:hypothetical protein
MASTLRQRYIVGDDTNSEIYLQLWKGMNFTVVEAHAIDQVDLYLSKTGSPVGTLTVAIYKTDDDSKPTGSALTSTTKSEASIAAGPAWVAFALTPYNLSAGTKYCIVLHNANTGGGANFIGWRMDQNDGAYTTGGRTYSTTGGATWGVQEVTDELFKEYGEFYVGGANPVDKTYSKKLIAIGNNEVWYQTDDTTLVELVAAKNDIDVTAPLTVVEAFQKVFLANGSNLKVIDFINTKLTVTAMTTAPTRGDVLTQVTSEATMIVDFVNAAKTAIYGKTTSGTFDTASAVDGGDMDPARTPSAVDEASTTPHWYDWTVYPGGTFGEMTSSGYLVTRYRGRLCLSGDPNLPHMWYMSKVAVPWNWLYSTNPLDAIAGNNVNAGEIGDIIRTLIPFGDDFLVFGCANSIHILDGDAQHGGSIDEITGKTGIFSFTAWTKDGEGNLFFFGNHGIYKMEGGRSKPVNITKRALPNFAKDWAINPATHRVVLAYDGINRGIIIAKTVIADGACTGYFYSQETDGFYPITFANTANGIYYAFDYNADSPTTRKLLLGCADGYIKRFKNTNKNDEHGASGTQPISSYFTVVEALTKDLDKAGKLMSLTVELAGGGAGGAFVDSDGCGYRTYTADDAESVLEKSKALVAWADGQNYLIGDLRTYDSQEYRCIVAHLSATGADTHEEPDTNVTDWELATFSTGTLSGVGRKNRIRDKIRAAWLAIKFYNSTASETFGISNIFGIVKGAGKIK